jgi:hemin uptake protein HemP
MSSTPEPNDAPAARPEKEPPRIISTQELFDGRREILIEHAGEQYRLRITRRNKLILQK